MIAVGAVALGSISLPSRPGSGLAADLFSLLEDRSPGERAPGALTQSKPYAAASPFERVLPTIRSRPAAVAPSTPGSVLGVLAAPDAPIAAVPGVVPVVAGPVDTLGGGLLGGLAAVPAVFGPGFGGSPSPGGPGGVTPAPAPTPGIVSAVPEPATWAMMLLGFGVVGLSMRKGRRTGPTRSRTDGTDATSA